MHSRELNLHPSDHPLASLGSNVYDVIVIGSGPPGRAVAARASASGLKALIIETELFGGDCPFWACIPSKALLRPFEALEAARAVGGARELISNEPSVDVKGLFDRRDMFTRKWDDTFIVKISEAANVDIVRGRGRIAGIKKVSVQEHKKSERMEVEARHAVILATGSDLTMPDIPGLMESKPWTPREAVSANQVPEHVVIVGGGAVGCEMATAYASFGKVTLVCSGKELLPKYEPEAGKRVRQSLTARGVDVLVSARVTAVSRVSHERVEVTLSAGDIIYGSEILIATGRRPRTQDVGLEKIGLQGDQPLQVDDSLCVTSVTEGWLYAVGDASGRSNTTHMGNYQARIAADGIIAKAQSKAIRPTPWSKYSATADHAAVPQVTVTEPNVATVGLSFGEAKERGLSVKEVAVDFAFPGALLHGDNYAGWAQWVVDTESNKLIGATFVGREASSLLHASTVAIVGEVPLDRLWHAIPSFPTMSEIYMRLMEACGL